MTLQTYHDVLYGPNYEVHGTPAVLDVSETFGSVDVTVIDKTIGQSIGALAGATIETILPYCTVRRADLDALGVPVADLDGAIITFNSKTWRIEAKRPLPSPGGEVDGELALILVETS